ncbi:MAG: DUF4321 domain-containing protein [Elusimicrobia bacterium]|nr:DUF4321 domain-containing protein [Elusimicrobiota bacterium]MBU2615305.1 DUF4321 domain-containing protein [Elusimicrobiota bacterium]
MSKNIFFFLLVIIVGALIGSFLGKFIESAFPAGGSVRDLFATEISAGLSPTNLDLRIIDLTFGCMVKINVMAVLGMVVAAWVFRLLFSGK